MHTVRYKANAGPDFLCRYMLLRTECPTQHSAQSKGRAMMEMTTVSGYISKLMYKAAQLDQGRSTHNELVFLLNCIRLQWVTKYAWRAGGRRTLTEASLSPPPPYGQKQLEQDIYVAYTVKQCSYTVKQNFMYRENVVLCKT